MTVDTSMGLRPTLAYTIRAKDDQRYFSGTQADPRFTLMAKDDHKYFSGTQVDPSFHCKG